MNGAPKLLKNLITLAGGELASRIISFVGFAYLARTLAPADYGSVELAATLAMVATMAVEIGTGTLGARELARDPSRTEELAASIPATRAATYLLVFPCMGLIGTALAETPQAAQLIWFYALAIAAVPATQRWLFQAREEMWIVAVGQLVRTATFICGVIVLVHSAGDLVRVGWVEVAAASATAAWFVYMQRRRVTPFRMHTDLRGLRSLVSEGWSLGAVHATWAVTASIPTVALAAYSTTTALGYYGSAQRVAMAVVSLSFVYHFNLFPTVSRAARAAASEFEEILHPSMLATAWGGSAVALAVSLAAPELCTTLFGADFAPAAVPLQLLIWMVPVHLVSGHARWLLVADGKQHMVLRAQIAGAVTAASVALLTVKNYGAVGAAAALLLASLSVWAVAHLHAVRFVRPLPWFSAVAKPLLTAGLCTAAATRLDTPPAWTAVIASTWFAVSALVVEPMLLSHARRLAGQIRAHRAAAHPPLPVQR